MDVLAHLNQWISAQMCLPCVLQEPTDIKDWACGTTRTAGYGCVHCAVCVSRHAIYVVFVINDAPWSRVIYSIHSHS